VNSSVGSLRGTSGEDGSTSCPCARKYSRNAARISDVVVAVAISSSNPAVSGLLAARTKPQGLVVRPTD